MYIVCWNMVFMSGICTESVSSGEAVPWP